MKISFAGLGPDLLYLTKNMFQPDFQVDLTTVISKEEMNWNIRVNGIFGTFSGQDWSVGTVIWLYYMGYPTTIRHTTPI